jgi:endogenous inhibitor of DNA gyrase (YacG/DUF329 family)
MGTARKEPTGPCPICRRPAVRGAVVSATGADPFPFCSFRCQLIDLGKWLGEEYRIADGEDQSGGGAEGMPGDDDGSTSSR